MAKNKTPKADRLPLGKFLAWKSSDITSAGVFLIVTTYMSMFCTDYLGMTPLAVGNIILISNIIDFFTDLIAAYVIDNTRTKWGKARPYELGAVGMTLCTTLIFITPNGWTDTLKIVWVFSMYTFLFGVFNTFRTSANVPYLLSIMSFVLLPTMFLFPVLMKKLSASQIIALGAVFSCLGYIVNYFAGASMTMLMIGGIITAFAMLPVSYLGNMVQMDLCTYNQYLGLPRMDASIGALFNGFGTQLGQGFGGWLLGFALTAAGYVASEGDAIVAQPESAITRTA